MRPTNQKGFTIIEIILFLALSSLFLTIAFVGVRGRTANVQFTDSMRSLQSFLTSQENKVLNGVNSSPTAPLNECGVGSPVTGTSNNCVLIGRVVTFGKSGDFSNVTVSVLYGSKPTSEDVANKADLVLIDEANPEADLSNESFDISWGTQLILDKSVNTGKSGVFFDSIGWLRSPGSTRIIPIAYDESTPGDYYRQGQPNSAILDEVETKLCFSDFENRRVASLTFGDGTGASSIELIFDDGDCK